MMERLIIAILVIVFAVLTGITIGDVIDNSFTATNWNYNG